MKTFVSLLVLIAATAAFAVTDFERFDKQVAKYATQLGGQPRGLCLCRDAALARVSGISCAGRANRSSPRRTSRPS